jgi:hypothetical protein
MDVTRKKKKNQRIVARPKNQNTEPELKPKRNAWQIVHNLRLLSH